MSAPALLSIALTPRTTADRVRLRAALISLQTDDPSIRLLSDKAATPVIIGAVTETQLEILLDRLRRDFGVEAFVGRPLVMYKEALTRSADGEAKYAKHADGVGQYAHTKVHVFPGDPGSGYVFESAVVAGEIPAQFIEPVKDAIREAAGHGVVAGYPVNDVRVVLYDGSYHDADSSEAAFRIAGSMAFADAARKASPVLLEPIMRVGVVAPEDNGDDVRNNLVDRRAQIKSQEVREGRRIIQASVPLADLFGYASDLREHTRGRGTFAMRFDRYAPVPSPEDDGSRDALVCAPPKRPPLLRHSSIALPEPDDEDAGNGL